MSGGNVLAPHPGGRVTPARFIPPLPPGIPILPGELVAAKPRKRLSTGRIVILTILALAGWTWYRIYRTDYDPNVIDPAITQAVLARAPKGTRIPVTLWDGPRVLIVRSAFYTQNPLETCMTVDVIDPQTGALNPDPGHQGGYVTCVDGLAYRIK